MRLRFAIAGIIHETNTYAVDSFGETQLAAFERYAGEDVISAFSDTNHQVGGFIAGAARLGIELVPVFLGQATPSGTIAESAYLTMKQAIIDGLRSALPVDGVLLALHGAGVAAGVEDIEGDLAAAVRAVMGSDVPIAAAYDLHGNLTQEMVANCQLTLPCRLYPHTDFGVRGEETVELLARIAHGALKPVTVMRQLPMLPYIVPTDPGFVPAAVNDLCSRFAALPGVIDCSWFHGFPYADIARPFPSVVCTTDGDRDLAARCADEVAAWIWNHRDEFRPKMLTPEEGVARALAAPSGPVVINEYADNPGGGTPGDGTFLLRALLAAAPPPGTCCFASINDAETVGQAVSAGVGSRIKVRLGGKLGPLQGQPIEAEADVRAITDGRFYNRPGSMFSGVHFDLGTMCRLTIGGVDVVLASRAEQIYDIEPFQMHGIDALARKVIALKGANHFRAAFNPLAAQIITVDSLGLSSADILSFPRRQLAEAAWPIEENIEY
ncbi:M81 family metallopeptidase [Thauera sp. SDU_THAU2]|uniref:M81 family metallopeptidase n=1 Tax=Thauera sp. SDU_THAU2 TaxID=3136633 RepID=UPI00311EDED6